MILSVETEQENDFLSVDGTVARDGTVVVSVTVLAVNLILLGSFSTLLSSEEE